MTHTDTHKTHMTTQTHTQSLIPGAHPAFLSLAVRKSGRASYLLSRDVGIEKMVKRLQFYMGALGPEQ